MLRARWILLFLLIAPVSMPASYGQDHNEIEDLREQLRSGEDVEVRLNAAQALRLLRAKEAVPDLCMALRSDGDADVRGVAAQTLGYLGAKEAVPNLREALHSDEDAGVRRAAALALGQLGVKDTAPEVAQTLRSDGDADVRRAAAQVLGHLGVKEMVPEVAQTLRSDVDADVRKAAALALGHLGAKEAVPNLREALHSDGDANVRRGAAEALGQLGAREAVSDLREALRSDEDVYVRRTAAETLGQLGAREAVPDLREALRLAEDVNVRRAALRVLGQLGAEEAVPDLCETLRSDEDVYVRRATVETLGQLEAKEAVPDLRDALRSDGDLGVRRTVIRVLGQLGAKEATPDLREALRSARDVYARRFAAHALDQLGAKEAVPDLVETLRSDGDAGVRKAAAQALGHLGAKAVAPDLVRTLRLDGDADVRKAAAEVLGQLGAKEAVPDLVETLRSDRDADIRKVAAQALGHLGAKEAVPDLAEVQDVDSNPSVRKEAELALARIGPIQSLFQKWIRQHPRTTLGVFGVALYLTILLLVFYRRPLWILNANETLKPYTDYKLPKGLGELKVPLRHLVALGFLHYCDRVLDAWVARYVEIARRRFLALATVNDRRVYVPLSVHLDRRSKPELQPEDLGAKLSERACLLLWGEGGAGKTSLACLIAGWGLDKKLQKHAMLPILIEPGFETGAEGVHKSLTEAIRGHLEDTIGGVSVPVDLLEQLLKKRRLLVIVDGFSEMSPKARDKIRPDRPDFPVHSLIVTSRRPEQKHLQVSLTELQPLRVEADRLSAFVGTYLSYQGWRDRFTDTEFLDSCTQLSRVVHERNTTALLAKLFADQLISAKEYKGHLHDLPKSIPMLMLGYLNNLNQKQKGRFKTRDVHRVAKTVAWECVKGTFGPGAAQLDHIDGLLEEEDLEIRRYLEYDLQILRKVSPSETHVRFSLDPLAEYLAGLWCVEELAGDEEKWKEFFRQADEMEYSETIAEYLLAVHDCILADASVPRWVPEELGKRAGLDLEELVEARQKRTIRNLLRNVGNNDLPSVARAFAIEQLLKEGAQAEEVVPSLVDALRSDEALEVRWWAAVALGRLKAYEAVPVLQAALRSDPKATVRAEAGVALGRLGASTAIPNLRKALRSDEFDGVRWSAARALGELGATEAIPDLREILRSDEEDRVRVSAAEALGELEAKEAVPDLIEALRSDGNALVRQSAAKALELLKGEE